MARQTFTGLQNTSKDYISASSGSLAASTIANFINEHINKAVSEIKTELANYVVFADDYSFTTVASTQNYDLPADFSQLETATLTVGSVDYPLRPIHSRAEWDRINEIDFSGTTIPQYIFIKGRDFLIYPTPQDAYTGTLVYVAIDKEMDTADYSTGTVTCTNADATVTGAGTTFTADMVGRWFKATTDGEWYKVSTFTSTTSLELDATFQGTTGATLAYIIGESPNIPQELHELIPHYVSSKFYAGPRKDFASAQAHLNFFNYGNYAPSDREKRFPMGGIKGAIIRYSGTDTGAIVYRQQEGIARFDERWSTTLS